MTEARRYGGDDILEKRCPDCGSDQIRMRAKGDVVLTPQGHGRCTNPRAAESVGGCVECCSCGREIWLSAGEELVDESAAKELRRQWSSTLTA
jgi:hypothetical protein